MPEPAPAADTSARAGAAPEFIDEATIHVRGGRGGNGCVSFRREAHVPRGGPDGGDGGRGGDVVLEATDGVTSLLALHRHPHQRAEAGGHGEGMRRTGRDAPDTVLAVPVGTIVTAHDSGEVVADLAVPGQRLVVAPGGRGGRGNVAFANRHRRIPRFAEHGEQVTERSLRLELQVIADVGLVGFPSAGKSSLIARVSAARPRVEAWPFTTLTPHLGVMPAGETADGAPIDVVLADVPGLVPGAVHGRGLGHRFLRHVQRCGVLLHVVDAAPFDLDRDPLADLDAIRKELGAHDPALLERTEVVALNKVDLPDGQAMADIVHAEMTDRGFEVFEISAVTGAGIDPLRYRLGELVHAGRPGRSVDDIDPDEDVVIRLPAAVAAFTVTRDDTGMVQVVGERVERWVQMLPLEIPEAVRYLQGRLQRAGVDKALAKAGVITGQDVRIGDMVFEFTPALKDLSPTARRAATEDGEDGEDEG